MTARPPVDPMQVLNDPAAMRGLLLTYTEKVIALESRVGELEPKAEALDRIAAADGSMNPTLAAKALQVQPKRLFDYLRTNHWLYVKWLHGGRSMTIKVLVPISGGKDSQAALKLALQTHHPDEVRGLFCDTRFEHPMTYAHVEKLRTLYGNVQIDTVCGGSVLEKSIKYGRFPGGGARHCTDELKIRETRIYCKALAEQQGGFEVWYGMRSKESSERAKRYAGKVCDELYAPHEVMPSKYPKYLDKMGVMFRLCILDWTEADVLGFLAGEENPLYSAGFPRVGCFPCLASGDAWKEKAFRHDDFGRNQLSTVAIVSAQIGKSVWTSKGGKARNADLPACELCAI